MKKVEVALENPGKNHEARVKELECFYGLSKLTDMPDISFEEILQEMVNLIPPAWQYPEITCARICFSNKEYRTENFKETRWKLSAGILVFGEKKGSIEVCYLEERPGVAVGPFMRSEVDLIYGLAERLGKIADRYEAEELLEAANMELEEKNEKLRKLDQLKSQFVANVSHEFRGPLTIVKESIEQVIDGVHGVVNDNQREILERAAYTSGRLARLSADLLNITRIELGRRESKRQKIDFAALVNDTLADYKNELSKKKIEIRIIESEPVGDVWGDRDMLTEVVINLLNNAIKYTPRGGRITIELEIEERKVQFNITDTGSGIPKAMQDKIFDKFERVQIGNEEGTGLGLPIAKDIVELHKGKIWFTSETGKGTTFSFMIPKSLRRG